MLVYEQYHIWHGNDITGPTNHYDWAYQVQSSSDASRHIHSCLHPKSRRLYHHYISTVDGSLVSIICTRRQRDWNDVGSLCASRYYELVDEDSHDVVRS